jgi:hypothetical protein
MVVVIVIVIAIKSDATMPVMIITSIKDVQVIVMIKLVRESGNSIVILHRVIIINNTSQEVGIKNSSNLIRVVNNSGREGFRVKTVRMI